MSSYHHSNLKWYHVTYMLYQENEKPSMVGQDVLAISKAEARRVMVEDVLNQSIYADLKIAYMGTWAQYQSMYQNAPDNTDDQERQTIIS